MKKRYISLNDLKIYRLARKLSEMAWKIYQKLDWQLKKIIGDQFIRATDSVGANIAEGYGRFHYLDKARFYYNARGSLLESRHWLDLLNKRGLLDKKYKDSYLDFYRQLRPGLNALINSVVKAKNP